MATQQEQFNKALEGLTPQERQTYISKNPNVVVGGQTFTAQGNNYNVSTNLNASDVSNIKPINVTQPNPQTEATGLGESIGSQANTFATNAEKDKQALDKSRDELTTAIKSITGEVAATDQAYKDTGVDVAKQELSDINNQIIAEQVSNRRKIEELQKNPQGLFGGALQSEIDRINRESTSKQADLAVIQMAKQNNYANAKEIADRQVAMEMEKQKNKIEALRITYEDNKEQFTKSEQRQFDAMIKAEERKYEEEKQTKTDIKNLAIDALQNGAPVDVAQRMQRASSIEAAVSIGGQYVGSYDRAIKQAQVNKLIAEAAKDANANQAIVNVSNVDPSSPTYIQDVITASAGGKELTGEQTKPISKALTVIGQIDSLTNTLSQTDTGPLLGIIRSNNPYDVKASLVKAQLQAIIPNLARGVYGEVGVLTDTDIANYTKTLGNLKKTSDINDLLTAMTLKTIKSGIDDQLEVFAASGRDVSGFYNLYNRLDEKINSIESKLGISQEQQQYIYGTNASVNAGNIDYTAKLDAI